MNLKGVIITVDDLRPPHCAPGIKKWFAEHNLDLREFLTNGIDAQTLYDTGDHLAVSIVERKVNGKQG